jgi:Uma2 family endonuclease
MGQAPLQLPMSAAESLAWDETQVIKHEFLAGEVLAMVGATKAHAALTINLAMALRQHLRGSSCSVFATDVKLRIEAADAYFYPDLLVTCSGSDREDPLIVREPVLVIEVLSPSTTAHDLGAKFAACRQSATLREVVFVHPDMRRCDVFRKGAGKGDAGLWVLQPFAPDQALHLASVELEVPSAALWDEVPAPVKPASEMPPGVPAPRAMPT